MTDAGFFDHLRSFAATAFEYIGARLQLAGLESREASGHYLKIALLVFAALVAVLFGYVFICGAIVGIVSALLDIHWMWGLLGMGLLHVAAAAVCLWVAYNRLQVPMFTATLNEFKKDQAWLTQQRPN